MRYFLVLFGFLVLLIHCHGKGDPPTVANLAIAATPVPSGVLDVDSTYMTIHVFVALCDNKYQGIVPVGAKIGNGQDPENNLYWGCKYGVKTFFKQSRDWKFIKAQRKDSILMERIVFQNTKEKYYLIADAYNGKYIKTCTQNFLKSCAGQNKDTLNIAGKGIGIGGCSKLLCYIGHDGLMDFALDEEYVQADTKRRDAVILACISQKYFAPHLKPTGAQPLLWSTGLMSPEAYTLHDAIHAYISDLDATEVHSAAASAYSKYQKCSSRAASNLLVSGW